MFLSDLMGKILRLPEMDTSTQFLKVHDKRGAKRLY
jgi:hypothetical protein